MATGTQADLKTRIASELRRSDLTDQIADAIADAIAIYQKVRLRFCDTSPVSPPEFATVDGQYIYTVADNANIGTMFFIDYLNVEIGSTTQELGRRTPQEINLLLQQGTQAGQPTDWAYQDDSILIYPVPAGVWNLILGGHRVYPAPASDAETGNKWMLSSGGERLIRARAKYEIALHVTRNPTMQVAMSPEQPPPGTAGGYASWRYLQELRGESSKIRGRSRVRAMAW